MKTMLLLKSCWSLLSVFSHCMLIYCNNRCLDSIIHAEHKSILEEMRSDYHISNSVEPVGQNSADSEKQVVANGKDSSLASNDIIEIEDRKVFQDMQVQLENSMLSDSGFDLRSLLRSLEGITSKKDYEGGSRFVPNRHHYAPSN